MEGYVIVARTKRGSYFVSEEIFDRGYFQMVKDKFQSMVDYFGGGRVMVYKSLSPYPSEN